MSQINYQKLINNSQRPYSVCSSKNNEQYNQKCVCQICTCGSHRCPQGISQYPPDSLQTTFQKDYKPYQVQQSMGFKEKPKLSEYHYAPDQLVTQYRQEYRPFTTTAEKFKKHPNDFNYIDLPFPKGSEYSANYIQFPDCSSKPFQSRPYKTQYIPFNASSTYKNDFRKFQTQQHPQLQIEDEYEAGATKIPFNSSSIYKQDYLKFNQPPTKSLKQEIKQIPQLPLDAQSNYNMSYKWYDPKLYSKGDCPISCLPQRPCILKPGKQHLQYISQKNQWD